MFASLKARVEMLTAEALRDVRRSTGSPGFIAFPEMSDVRIKLNELIHGGDVYTSADSY